MNRRYKTLDEYLDDLDAIKAQVAEQTQGMSSEEVKAHFANAAQKLYELTGKRVRVRRGQRKKSAPAMNK